LQKCNHGKQRGIEDSGRNRLTELREFRKGCVVQARFRGNDARVESRKEVAAATVAVAAAILQGGSVPRAWRRLP
jgi:hypothetical protein